MDPVDLPYALPRHLYYQVVHALRLALPPPASNQPHDLLHRDRAAIAQVASMLPANAEEAMLAAQVVAAGAQALDCLRLLRRHEADGATGFKCTAQAASMMRQANAARSLLMRLQAAREKREAHDQRCDAAASIEYCATGLMSDALGAMPSAATPRDTAADCGTASVLNCSPGRPAGMAPAMPLHDGSPVLPEAPTLAPYQPPALWAGPASASPVHDDPRTATAGPAPATAAGPAPTPSSMPAPPSGMEVIARGAPVPAARSMPAGNPAAPNARTRRHQDEQTTPRPVSTPVRWAGPVRRSRGTSERASLNPDGGLTAPPVTRCMSAVA